MFIWHKLYFAILSCCWLVHDVLVKQQKIMLLLFLLMIAWCKLNICALFRYLLLMHTQCELHCCYCYQFTTHVLSTWIVIVLRYYNYFADVCMMWTVLLWPLPLFSLCSLDMNCIELLFLFRWCGVRDVNCFVAIITITTIQLILIFFWHELYGVIVQFFIFILLRCVTFINMR